MSTCRRVMRRALRDPAKGEGGFTIIELMIVVGIIGILAVFAVPNLQALIPRYRLNRGAKEMAGVVQMARLMAISQGRDHRICMLSEDPDPTGTDPASNVGLYQVSAWNTALGASGAWDVLPIEETSQTTDTRQDEGTYNMGQVAGGYGMRGISITDWTSMGGPGTGNDDCMVFSTRGWLSNPLTDFNAGYIYVYFRNKYENPKEDMRTVRISRGGAVQILNGMAVGGSGSSEPEETLL